MSKKKDFTKKNPALDGYTFSGIPKKEEPLKGQATLIPEEEEAEQLTGIEALVEMKRRAQTKSERIVLLVKPQTKKDVQDLAAFYGLSVNALVGHVLQDFLEQAKKALENK